MFIIEFYDDDFYNPHAGTSKYLFKTEREAQQYLLKMEFKYSYEQYSKELEWESQHGEYVAVIRRYELYEEGMEVEDNWKDE